MNNALRIGHVLAAVLGIVSICDGVGALVGGLPYVLAAVALIVGVVLPLLVYMSWRLRSRAAWAFLIAICGVFGATTTFGAPKTAHLIGIPIAAALVVPIVYLIAMTLLATNGEPYREGASHK